MGIRQASAVSDKEISDYALAAFVNEKCVAEDSSAIDGRVAGQNLGVHVAENHVGGPAVVPGKQPRPHADLVLQQRTQVDGRKMPEIENFHPRSWSIARRCI